MAKYKRNRRGEKQMEQMVVTNLGSIVEEVDRAAPAGATDEQLAAAARKVAAGEPGRLTADDVAMLVAQVKQHRGQAS